MTSLPGIAQAFATYSLVPYVGILFCPGAVVLGAIGIAKSYDSKHATEESFRRVCYASTIIGLVVLAAQLFLWWILYQMPTWANRLN